MSAPVKQSRKGATKQPDYEKGNRQAARLILASTGKYGGDDALPVRWARRVLNQPANSQLDLFSRGTAA